eukprot:TRINITY_DN1662_c0_g1_i2.p1 TRINITY_DN1662_c0_g1~~TRINITY_DN1662_c0_g1_i2.p1  ORF type:complete len:102 (+),score=13.38 TRINITY_DN1662_c0_g1_i2:609-914(+)
MIASRRHYCRRRKGKGRSRRNEEKMALLANLLQSFYHYDAVTAYNHHTDIIPLIANNLHGAINDKIHELVEAPEDTNHRPIGIKFDVQLLVHVLLQIRGLS